MQIFDSFIDAGQTMCRKDKLEYYTALVEYMQYGYEPELSGVALAVFTAIKPTLDKSVARSKAGAKGGKQNASKREANAKQNASKTQAKAKQTPSKSEANAKQNESKSEANFDFACHEDDQANSNSNSKETLPKGSVKKAQSPRFQPPTESEVSAYSREQSLGVDAGRFVDFYASKGWKVGSSPMRDWKAAVRNWARRDSQPQGDAVVVGSPAAIGEGWLSHAD